MNIPNNIELQNESSYDIPLQKLQRLTAFVLQEENIYPQSIVNLLITEKDNIRDYNHLYRGVNHSTDVLAFPSEQKFLPLLGDIIIDIDVCFRQKGNKSWQDELKIVYLHGLLHLLGYEHVSQKQKERMETLERRYLNIEKENINNSGR